MKFLKDTSIAEISSIVYLIFPIAGIFLMKYMVPNGCILYQSLSFRCRILY